MSGILSGALLIIFSIGLFVGIPDMLDKTPQQPETLEIPTCTYNATVYIGDNYADMVQLDFFEKFDNVTYSYITVRFVGDTPSYRLGFNTSHTPLWRRSDGQQVYTVKDLNRTKDYLGCG